MTITEFQLIGSSDPEPITAGPDGNMWFTSHFPDRIDRISPSGVITQYPVPSPFEQPYNITAGPDGAVWFAAVGGALSTASAGIGRIDPVSGTITEFPQPAGSRPYGIATGPDGNLWTTDLSSHRISLTTTSGTTTVFPSTTYNRPLNIIAGPDGALWFTEDGMVEGGGGAIGRMTTSGSLSEYLLPTPLGHYSGAGRITVGPDGNLWFTWASCGSLPAAQRYVQQHRPHHTDRNDHRVPGVLGERLAAGRHHLRSRWKSVVHRERRQRHRSDLDDGRIDGRSRPDAEQRASRHRSRPGRQPVVHGSTFKQDRADLARSARPPGADDLRDRTARGTGRHLRHDRWLQPHRRDLGDVQRRAPSRRSPWTGSAP